jgi:hypothetical protein
MHASLLHSVLLTAQASLQLKRHCDLSTAAKMNQHAKVKLRVPSHTAHSQPLRSYTLPSPYQKTGLIIYTNVHVLPFLLI